MEAHCFFSLNCLLQGAMVIANLGCYSLSEQKKTYINSALACTRWLCMRKGWCESIVPYLSALPRCFWGENRDSGMDYCGSAETGDMCPAHLFWTCAYFKSLAAVLGHLCFGPCVCLNYWSGCERLLGCVGVIWESLTDKFDSLLMKSNCLQWSFRFVAFAFEASLWSFIFKYCQKNGEVKKLHEDGIKPFKVSVTGVIVSII